MPLYEFVCKKCRKLSERVCKWDERLKQKCEKCKIGLEHVMSVPGYYDIRGNNSASVPSRYSKKGPKS